MQYINKIENQKQFITKLVKKISNYIYFPYGISFELSDMFQTYIYGR